MKLRTSYFNPIAFRKDITRFAPSWALYTIFLLLTVAPLSGGVRLADALAECVAPFAALNLLYAFLNAQLLFGDLFSSRMSNALHAMPLRREGWLLTHVASGMAFSLVPNLLVCCVVMPLMGRLFFVAPLVILAATLQYLFFFGLAAFSVMCVGNRFAMALVYGILNFFSMLVCWFVDTLYLPLLPGVTSSYRIYQWLCPVVQACSQSYINIETEYVFTGEISTAVTTFSLCGESWLYISVCALVGLALLGLALVLYRRRKLEMAGDFLAVKPAEPVFLVLFSLTAGVVLQLCYSMFAGGRLSLFLPIGAVAGFFTGRMLLRRTVRVFQPRAFLGLAALAVALLASFFLTWLDPVGITRWLPEADQVSTVLVNPPAYYKSGIAPEDNILFINSDLVLTNPEEIEAAIDLHRQILAGEGDTGNGRTTELTLRYILKNGSVRDRAYTIYVKSPPGQLLRDMLSSPEAVFGTGDKETFLARISGFEYSKSDQIHFEDPTGLVDALWQDAENGNLPQRWEFYSVEDKTYVDYLTFHLSNGNTIGIQLSLSAENTLTWLKENGYFPPPDSDPDDRK